MYKRQDCEGDKTLCARYRIATKVGPQFVPANLYPNMDKIADEILQK